MIILSAWSTLGRHQWPITLPHPAELGDYTHTLNWNMWDHFSICQQCLPNLVDRKHFSASWPCNGTTYWSTRWESNPWPKTHNLGPGPLSKGQWIVNIQVHQSSLSNIALHGLLNCLIWCTWIQSWRQFLIIFLNLPLRKPIRTSGEQMINGQDQCGLIIGMYCPLFSALKSLMEKAFMQLFRKINWLRAI